MQTVRVNMGPQNDSAMNDRLDSFRSDLRHKGLTLGAPDGRSIGEIQVTSDEQARQVREIANNNQVGLLS